MLANFVQETANAPGTATTINLAGPVTGRRGFVAVFGGGATVDYVLDDGTQYEYGEGTITAGSPNTLTRTTVRENSLGTLARLNFSGATRVLCMLAAQRVVWVPTESPPWRPLSGVVQADFALPVWARRYRLTLQDVNISSLGAQLVGRFSSDGGATFLATANYLNIGNLTAPTPANVPYGQFSSTGILLSQGLNNLAANPWDATYEIIPGSGTLPARLRGSGIGVDNTPTWVNGYLGGAWVGAAARMNAIRVLVGAGTFSGAALMEASRS